MPKTFLRRTLGATLALATGATAMAAFSTPAQAAVPSDCATGVFGATSSRVLFHRYFAPTSTSTSSNSPLRLPWTPRSVAPMGGMGGGGDYSMNTYLILAGTRLYEADITSRMVNGKWQRSLESRTAGTNFGATRKFVNAHSQFGYGINKKGALYRYRVNMNNGNINVARAGRVSASGWGSIRNLTSARTISWGKGKADVLLGTASWGSLYEFVIPHAKPSAVKRYTLRSSGWNGYQALEVQSCGRGKDYVYIGIKTNGDAYRFYDPNGRDFSGKNLRGDGLRVRGLGHTHFDG